MFIFIFQKIVFYNPLPINGIINGPKLCFKLHNPIKVIEFTLWNVLILELKIYCGSDKFYGRSNFGQYDEVKNRAPFITTFGRPPASLIIYSFELFLQCPIHLRIEQVVPHPLSFVVSVLFISIFCSTCIRLVLVQHFLKKECCCIELILSIYVC